ncbi:hypothetical protein T492DRAFT_847415 [Pavlovales sp. CCMP2436]|nr:hypothetical protein T492DRAFT_847415 [Pavlovales sp. CCMP2436]
MLYVAVSRVRRLDQIAIVTTATCFCRELLAGHTGIEEYPVGDGRYIAELAIFKDGKLTKLIEVVVTSLPSAEKLAYYEELGLECKVIILAKEPTPPTKEHTPPAKEHSATACPPSMFSVDDSDD